MRPKDFWRLDAEEWVAIATAHNQREEALNRGEWERTRISSCILIQPHIRNKITPEKLLPLPWDKHLKAKEADISKEESMKIADRLLASNGQGRKVQH